MVQYEDTQGSLATEKSFVRSWIDETYLWYKDVRALPAATLDATNYATPVDYFNALKTPLLDFGRAGERQVPLHLRHDDVGATLVERRGLRLRVRSGARLGHATAQRHRGVPRYDD